MTVPSDSESVVMKHSSSIWQKDPKANDVLIIMQKHRAQTNFDNDKRITIKQ